MKDIPEWLVERILGVRGGSRPPGNSRARYGRVVFLEAGAASQSAMVVTDQTETPATYAIQVRFSSDGVTFAAITPTAITFEVRRGLDQLGGNVSDFYALGVGDTFPVCGLIGNIITVIAKGPENPVWVETVIAPTTSIDCQNESPTPAPTVTQQRAYNVATTSRYTVTEIASSPTSTGVPVCVDNPTRAQLYIQNNSGVPVIVGRDVASLEPGNEAGVFILPGGISAIHEWGPGGWSGPVHINVAPGAVDTGYVLVTEGSYS